MKNNKAEQDTPLPLCQLVKMTAPVFLFGVILPFVDIVTDLRMIIRLYMGVPGCSRSNSNNSVYHACVGAPDLEKYCQDNLGACPTERHQIFAFMLLGKYNLMYTRTYVENVFPVPFLLNYIASFLAWYRLEKNKLLTVVFPIFNLYSVFGWFSLINYNCHNMNSFRCTEGHEKNKAISLAGLEI